MKKILITGSTAYDLLLGHDGSFTDAIEPGSLEDLSVVFGASHFQRHHGGTGANIAWNLKLLGCDPLLVSTVGEDGGEYKALLEDRGIGTDYIGQIDGQVTSTAIIGTDTSERQLGFYHPGADAHGSWPDLSDDRDDIGYAIVSPRDEKLMEQAMQWCVSVKIPFFFDPGQRIPAFGNDELRRGIASAHGVLCNSYEWDLLKSRLKCTEESAALCGASLLIVTRGEEGVTVFDESGAHNIPACTADTLVNPTGAGDGFRAGLLAGLSSGWSLLDSARLGCSVGSFVVEAEGPLVDSLDLDLVWSRAEEAYGEKLPHL